VITVARVEVLKTSIKDNFKIQTLINNSFPRKCVKDNSLQFRHQSKFRHRSIKYNSLQFISNILMIVVLNHIESPASTKTQGNVSRRIIMNYASQKS